MAKKLSSILTGVSGEYFVAAELSQRGYIASITLRNTRGIDILASNEAGTKQIAIQVKTNQYDRRDWILSKKDEDFSADNLFYVFVIVKKDQSRPDYFIVPSSYVAKFVRESHANWLNSPGRGGRIRKDSSMRKFEDREGDFLERWDLLGLD